MSQWISRSGIIDYCHITQKFKLQEEQLSMQKTVKKIIEEDINPFVDQWEAEGQYPAKQVDSEL